MGHKSVKLRTFSPFFISLCTCAVSLIPQESLVEVLNDIASEKLTNRLKSALQRSSLHLKITQEILRTEAMKNNNIKVSIVLVFRQRRKKPLRYLNASKYVDKLSCCERMLVASIQ